MNHRQRVESVGTVSKPGRVVNPGQVQREPAAWLGGTRHKGGVTLHQALVWNVGTCEADARAALEPLVAGGTADDDSFHAAKTLTLEDADRLERIFGTAFRDAVLEYAARSGSRHAWFGPVPSAYGAHLVRMDAYTEGRPRTLDEVRETVLNDWRRDHVAARESERYAEMRARYEVDVAPFASIGDLVQP